MAYQIKCFEATTHEYAEKDANARVEMEGVDRSPIWALDHLDVLGTKGQASLWGKKRGETGRYSYRCADGSLPRAS